MNESTDRITRIFLPRRPRRPWAPIAVCLFALLGSAAGAAEEVKPLRHMVFKVGVLTTTRLEVKRSGTSVGQIGSGGNSDNYNAGVQAIGTVTADVIAATGDQGLVVDISEDAQTRKAAIVRVGVYPDGRLAYDAKQRLTDEEAFLLRFLARGLIAPGVGTGAMFAVSSDDKDAKEVVNFRVTGTDERGRLKLDVDGSSKVGGAQPYDGTLHGKLVYDQAKSVPVLLQLMTRTHRENVGELNTTDMTIDLDLAEDSFGAGAKS